MLHSFIQWEFKPPAGSHFGGVWERLIRSVRQVLYSLMREQRIKLDDEGLQTLFCEVEAILNGRPLTEAPDSVNDVNVLTPNHLILQESGFRQEHLSKRTTTIEGGGDKSSTLQICSGSDGQ